MPPIMRKRTTPIRRERSGTEKREEIIAKPAIEDYIGLIKHEVKRKYNGIPWHEHEDRVAEGMLLFCECLPYWKPERGKFSTLLTTQLRNNLPIPEPKNESIEYWPEISGPYPDPAKIVEFRDLISALNHDARRAVRIVFRSPDNHVGRAPKFLKADLRRAMFRTGLNNQAISKAFNEIQKTLL